MTASGSKPEFFAVIPAGGSGTRLWPLSRSQEPKFLLDLLGTGRSLLVDTVRRLEPFADASRVVVVTGEAHKEAVRKQLPDLPETNLLIEPRGKNSAAAVGLAAFVLNETNPNAVLGFFAADHVVGDDHEFREIVSRAIDAAPFGQLVTIGITPTEPSSAYGYIQVGSSLDGVNGVNIVTEFVEKPSFSDADRFVRSGNYLWNAGIFVGVAGNVVSSIEEFAPELAAGLRLVTEKVMAGQSFDAEWDALPSVAFDYAVAEPAARAGRFLVVPGSFGWKDVGDFASLASAQVEGASSRMVVVGDKAKVHPHNSSGIVVGSSGRIITVLGMEDVVIVDTADALLVTTKEHAQDVKQIVESMKEQGLEDLL